MEDQDSWTMGAFDVLGVELAYIKIANHKEAQFRAKS